MVHELWKLVDCKYNIMMSGRDILETPYYRPEFGQIRKRHARFKHKSWCSSKWYKNQFGLHHMSVSQKFADVAPLGQKQTLWVRNDFNTHKEGEKAKVLERELFGKKINESLHYCP